MASVTDADSVHASSYRLHNLLWQGHKGWLLPLEDVLTLTQLSNISLAQNKNLAHLFTMTSVGNYYIISHIFIIILELQMLLQILAESGKPYSVHESYNSKR